MTALRAAAAALAAIALVGAAARAERDEAPPLVVVDRPAEPLRAVRETLETAATPQRKAARLGVLLGVVGVPQPVGVQGMLKFADVFSLGAGVGTMPEPIGGMVMSAAGINGGKLSATAVEGEARLFPFRGSFWFGAGLGHMSLSASGTSRGFPVAVDVSTTYAAPRMGWLATWDSGFSLGLDLGAQIPLGPDVKVTTTSPQTTNIENLARALSALPLPTATVRLGFLL